MVEGTEMNVCKNCSSFGKKLKPIRNVQETADAFSYEVSAVEISTGCESSLTLASADSLISLGRTRSNIQLPAGSSMDQPIFIRFKIPDTAPPCQVRYQIQLFSGGGNTPYSPPIDIDLEIISG